MQRFKRELRNSFRNGEKHAILLIDLDNLKIMNDKYGHLYGDQALTLLGKSLKASTRLTDIPGRYGGDEFIVILPKTDVTGVKIVLERIYKYLEENPLESAGEKIPVTCSIGVVNIPSPEFDLSEVGLPVPHEYFDYVAEKLIEMADKALYKAKAEGKARYSFCDSHCDWPHSLPD